jgi:hypothetical protein
LRNPKDFWAGLLFLAIGAFAAVIVFASDYELGSARKMGPGYFPIWISSGLMLLGAILAFKSFATYGPAMGTWAIKPLVLITLGTVIFAAIVNFAGLAPAIFLLVVVASLSSIHFRLSWSLPLAAGLSVASVLVFVKGLGIAVPVMPHVLGY